MKAMRGFFPEEELWKFCKVEGILGGHPEYGKVPGVEASTGSLGHGLPIGFDLERIDPAIEGRMAAAEGRPRDAEGDRRREQTCGRSASMDHGELLSPRDGFGQAAGESRVRAGRTDLRSLPIRGRDR